MSTNITDKKDLWILVHILALLANQIFGKLSSLSTLLLRNFFSWFFHGILNPKENFSDSYPQTLKSYFSLYFWVNVFSVFFLVENENLRALLNWNAHLENWQKQVTEIQYYICIYLIYIIWQRETFHPPASLKNKHKPVLTCVAILANRGLPGLDKWADLTFDS